MGRAVLLIHGDKGQRDAARGALVLGGHAVEEAGDLNGAWSRIDTTRPDLILLPWTGAKGFRESLARLRESEGSKQSRVIVWAPHAELHEAINALEFGADDFITTPADRSELVARVNACLRRPAARIRPDQLIAGPIMLDKAVHCMTVRGALVELAPAEFRLMAFFLENQGRVFSRDELLRRAWSKNSKAGHRTVDVHVRRLRQLLEPFGCDELIQTLRGFGYRFVPPMRDSRAPQRSAQASERLGGS